MKRISIYLLLVTFLFISCSKQNPEKTTSNKKYQYDNDGMLVIDDKRTFIIGTYHLPKSNDPYKELSESGYNLVRVNAKKENLDQAYQNNLYAWMSIGYIHPDKVEQDRQRLQNIVKQFSNHPALLCWELVDEPAFTWKSAKARLQPEPLIETYKFIKQADPDHLLYMNHGPVNLVSTLQQYNPATDIVACDIYPVIPQGIRITYALFEDGMQGDLLNTYISQIGEYVDKMRRVAGPNRPVFMVLQGFAWEMFQDEKVRDTKMILYPTYEELRFMAYNAIIHSATGIIYWGTRYTPQPSPFWTDLKKVTRELGEMQPVLSSPTLNFNIPKKYHELGHSIDAGVELIVKSINDTTYILTANADKNPVKLSMLGLDEFSSAEVLSENRSVDIHDGELVDFYRPFDVHVYKLIESNR